jgi:predicted RNase H-like nuclease (RuvC/YqgF family)
MDYDIKFAWFIFILIFFALVIPFFNDKKKLVSKLEAEVRKQSNIVIELKTDLKEFQIEYNNLVDKYLYKINKVTELEYKLSIIKKLAKINKNITQSNKQRKELIDELSALGIYYC